MDKNMFNISICLKEHPVLKEKEACKVNYLNLLEYFVNKYSLEDYFANSILSLYKDEFLGESKFSYSEKKAIDFIEHARLGRGNKYNMFKYRYNFLIDCMFLNALTNVEKAEKIKNDILPIFNKKYRGKIEKLFLRLYYDKFFKIPQLDLQIRCWNKNRIMLNDVPKTILVTANMSAGKSTLINSIVGKKVSSTHNGACTAKNHFIYNKLYEDGFICKLDGDFNINADESSLINYDENNSEKYVSIGSFFRSSEIKNNSICLIDTPGVNSSLNTEHRDVTFDFIKSGHYDKVIYVINGSQIGTEDDKRYMTYIYDNVCKTNMIFVLNKLDSFKVGEDSIEQSIENLRKELDDIGFEDYLICPVSAYAGCLAKKYLYCEKIDEDESDELDLYIRKFSKDYYDLSIYYEDKYSDILDYPSSILNKVKTEKCFNLLKKSGILGLERILANK